MRPRKKRKRKLKIWLGAACGLIALLVVWRAWEEYSLRQPYILDVPFIDQREEWPSGCESVSAVMALRFAGADLSVDDFIDGYLPVADAPSYGEDGVLYGEDPRAYFLGDPRSEKGWGCLAPVMEQAISRALEDYPVGRAEESEGMSLSALWRKYVRKGAPVLVWATIGMEDPAPDAEMTVLGSGETYQWQYPMHCLLLVGKDRENFYFNDPSAGKAVAYPQKQAEKCFAALGSQAVAVCVRVGDAPWEEIPVIELPEDLPVELPASSYISGEGMEVEGVESEAPHHRGNRGWRENIPADVGSSSDVEE